MSDVSNTPSEPHGGSCRCGSCRVQHYYEISCEAIRRGEILERALRDIRSDEDLISEWPHLAQLIDSALNGERVA